MREKAVVLIVRVPSSSFEWTIGALRLHVGEPIRLGPAVAPKKEEFMGHGLKLSQLLRQVEELLCER